MLPNVSLKFLLGKVAVVASLMLVIGLLASVLATMADRLRPSVKPVLPPLPTALPPSKPVAQWRKWLDSDTAPMLSRAIELTVDHPRLSIDLHLTLPTTNPAAEKISGGTIQSSPQDFMEAAFGFLLIGVEKPLAEKHFSPPEWRVAEGVMAVHLHAEIEVDDLPQVRFLMPSHESADPQNGPHRIPRSLSNELSVKLSRALLFSMSPVPSEAISQQARWIAGSGASLPERVEFITGNPEVFPEWQVRRQSVPHSPRDLLQRLDEFLRTVPMLSSFLAALLRTLPLLFFLYFLGSEKQTPEFLSRLAWSVVAAITFFLVLALATGVENLMMLYGGGEWLSSVWKSLVEKFQLNLPTVEVSLISLVSVTPAIVSILAPALFFLRVEENAPESWVRMRRLAPWIALLCAVGFVCAQGGRSDEPWPLELLAVCGLVFLLLFTVSYLLSRALGPARKGDALAALLMALLIAVSSIWPPSLFRSTRELSFELFALALARGFLTFAMLMLVLRTAGISEAELAKHSRHFRIILLISSTILALPMFNLIDVPKGATYAGAMYALNITALSYQLLNLVPILWVGAILWYLHGTGNDTLQVGRLERFLGVLATSSLLFDPLAQWCFIPVTFLLGWAMLSLLVAHPAGRWQALTPSPPADVDTRRAQLNKLLSLNAAESAYNRLREHLRKKLASAEMDFEAYDKRLTEEWGKLQTLQQEARVGGLSVRELALAFGPQRTARDNALHGLRYGLMFAAPWIILGLRDLLAGTDVNWIYPLWQMLSSGLTLVAKWGVIGFFFGYFYSYLPGKSGLAKGVSLFLTIIIPSLALAAIQFNSQEEWHALAFWSTQVFIECMLLGLFAFDYATLRHSGYGDWRLLFQVHDLPSLGISVSSIALAIGGTITTLISSNAAPLAMAALRIFLPKLPSLPVGNQPPEL